MDVRIINCIRQYVKEKYVGGVIKISDIARHCPAKTKGLKYK